MNGKNKKPVLEVLSTGESLKGTCVQESRVEDMVKKTVRKIIAATTFGIYLRKVRQLMSKT